MDEYQDTNHAQYRLIKALVGDGSNDIPPAELCVVGDADQSIYAFRGATIRNIVEFERDFTNAKTILLEQNYRSTQNILSAANAVIDHNEDRRKKKLWTAAGDGALIGLYVADNEHDEARFIAEEIDKLSDKDIKYSDIAVFYRTNNGSRPVEDAFIRTDCPTKLSEEHGSTNAPKSAILWLICEFWRTQTIPSVCGELLTPRGAESVIEPKAVCRSMRTKTMFRSGMRCRLL